MCVCVCVCVCVRALHMPDVRGQASRNLQVWQGALGLANWLLNDIKQLRGASILELGSGPGLPGLVAALFGERVVLTDYQLDVLQNCQASAHDLPGVLTSLCAEAVCVQANVAANASLTHQCTVLVRQLDWSAGLPSLSEQTSGPFSWSATDCQELQHLDLILAAGVRASCADLD